MEKHEVSFITTETAPGFAITVATHLPTGVSVQAEGPVDNIQALRQHLSELLAGEVRDRLLGQSSPFTAGDLVAVGELSGVVGNVTVGDDALYCEVIFPKAINRYGEKSAWFDSRKLVKNG